MANRFSIKEIAHQAGLSTATVDRVVNDRQGVRRQTANRVRAAIRELEAQEAQLSMSGRKLMIDVVVEAPQAFLDALNDALRSELPLIQTAIFRARSDLRARFPIEKIVAALDRAERLKSDGVILMAPDAAPVRQAVDRLTAGGIPVVTLATDMPGTSRTGYAGLDNHLTGETAAWLMQRWLAGQATPHVVITKRNEGFRGEGEREAGFRAAMSRLCADARMTLLVQGKEGSDFTQRVADTVRMTGAAGLYSIGGGNRDLIRAISRTGLPRPIVIGHDLDPENRALLKAGALDAVLYHELTDDIRHALQVFLAVHSQGAVEMPGDGTPLRIMLPPMLADGQTGG
ncbi:LacI family transcriptional regulator /monosaccharide ABC transporter substrate-binding protein (CUT2 family) [Primorskyibacter sedentarius]|uniref:LacI family transcriptional regulator /monosaccharide ABC transporter substrate-binding protein (CUT2 family) n=1 Tax=Primorskyibacter sedentarius TaxID=745311 RepID=A0A4R3J413_9RHOB|nr:LacI family DNA-binding transcriptional regulator [Primorskyibacter sedentarius]TCS59884.1 LacI family transcriptional regulator /monosaccharide ABC transporter substrate-binding protein (CUT2 family) [Primorskyibacter sedentarius]